MTALPDTLRIIQPDPLARDLRDFFLDLDAANRTAGTTRFYRQKLEPFLDYAKSQGIVKSQDLTPSLIRRWLAGLGEGHNPGGVRAYWRATRAFCRFLVRDEILDKDPTASVRAPKVDLEPLPPVDLDSISAMLATCDKSESGLRDRTILMGLLDTGLRAGEATALNVGDLDLSDGAVVVRHSKSRKSRTVFVGKRTRRLLAQYLRMRGDPGPSEPLWLAYSTTGDRGRLAYSSLRDIVRRRAKAAGVKPPTLHSFRRGFAILMLRAGADVVTLSRMMGHGSLPVLMRYLKQERGDLGQVHSACSPVDRLL
jgi:integrase/recombinase XerC